MPFKLIASLVAVFVIVKFIFEIRKTLYGRFGSRSSKLYLNGTFDVDGHTIYIVGLRRKAERTEETLQSAFRQAGLADANRDQVMSLKFMYDCLPDTPLSSRLGPEDIMTLKGSGSTLHHACRSFDASECFICVDAVPARTLELKPA